MKRGFSISTKIWLSLSILIFGYLVSMIFGFVNGKKIEAGLHIVSEHVFLAARQSQLALLAFNEQIKCSDDAVVLGESSFIDCAKEKENNVRGALETIIRLEGIAPDKKKRLQQILSKFNRFSSSSHEIYIQLSSLLESTSLFGGDEFTDKDKQLEARAFELAQETKLLLIEFTNWSNDFADLLKKELSDISLNTMRQRFLNLIVFFVVVMIALSLISIIVKHSISKPLEKTFMLENAVEQSIDGIAVADHLGKVGFVNKAWAKLHGYEPSDLIGKHVSFFYSEEEYQSQVIPFMKMVEAEGAHEGEIRHRKKNGEEFVSMMTATLLWEINHQPTKIMIVARDITEKKKQEKELIEARDEAEEANKALQESLELIKRTQQHLVESEKMASLGGLVAGVAHEINTPVGVGVTASSFLEDKTKIFQELVREDRLKRSDLDSYLKVASESSSIIYKNLNRAADLIKSFKQVAVDQSGEVKRKFKLKQYTDELFISLGPKIRKTPHKITIHCPEDLEIDRYPGIYSQIITNFVMNSLNHGFEENQEGVITIDIRKEGGELLINYADNGKGMEKETLKKIFDPFFTTSRGQGGTGLGMHIVYNLVTMTLGGKIRCFSRPGEGTTFSIRIPFSKS